MGRNRLGLTVVSLAVAACGGPAAPSTSTNPSSASSPSVGASTELVANVDVGGRTMHLVCVGPTDTGEPTILLEAGGGGDSLSWADILEGMQSQHRLCAYDLGGERPAG